MSPKPLGTYVLDGRIVTMGPRGIIEEGAIFVDAGVIEFVQPASDPLPDSKYDGVPRIRTGDTIYPGLIELHNHLSYNAMPLWDVPAKYSNNGQWRGTEPYTRDITKPSQVLGQTPGAAQALVRYAECRALLGGVTTSQGISLASAGGIQKYYRGIVRNVESPLHPDLPAAETKIANPPTGGAGSYLADNLTNNTCYLQHLSEGNDDTARGWFLRLRIDADSWAVNDVLCGIHSTALNRDDFDVLASGGASIVWSPLSNYLLYGQTTDIEAAHAAGVNIALGSDWAPSGSKNLLGELKVAWLANDAAGGVLTPEELVATVTRNPAVAAKWDHRLGTIQPDRLADLVAVNGLDGDPYEKLILARETSVTLVVIDGVPRIGQKNLMRRFWPGRDLGQMQEIDVIDVDRSTRCLYLTHDDDLLDGLSLTQAIADLSSAMLSLPQLAIDVDNAVAGSVVTATGVTFAGGLPDSEGNVWRVVPDFERPDLELALAGLIPLAAEPYSFWVTEPIALPPITAADDRDYVPTLARAPNVPEQIRQGLLDIYDVTLPSPETVGSLDSAKKPIAEQVSNTTTGLGDFLTAFGELTLEDRKLIVDQALLLLQENYVHLPLKRAMYAVDPLQQLRLLRYRLDDMSSDQMPREIEFHSEVTSIFNSLRDLHTGYRLPAPFNTKVAWLPFLIEEVSAGPSPRYLITKWVGDAWPREVTSGAEVTHWNGMKIATTIARNAERQAGGNPDARHARGIHSLTVRPLAKSLAPDEEWVTIRWRDESGESHEFTQEWLVFEPGSIIGPGELLHETTALGLDDLTDDVQEARKVLFAPKVAEAESRAGRQELSHSIRDANSRLASFMPGVFRAAKVRRSDGRGPDYGYIRIFTFNVPDADAFVNEFVRLAEALPPSGLTIDVRGNGGGLIYAAEQLLDVLTPVQIEPEKAQFINTPLNLEICRRHAPSVALQGLDLGTWVDSIEKAVRTGATYSLGFPITPPEKVSRLGQRYYGPVVLITDPLCYSATDMFAAGFQDHDIGPIIGVGGATGAGGANVWTHRLLRRLTEPNEDLVQVSPYRALPRGADVRVAIRRTTRVKKRSGDVLEDLGVEPDFRYRMTQRDVVSHNEDLMDAAIDALADGYTHSIDIVRTAAHRDRLPTVTLEVENIDRIETTVDGRGLPTHRVTRQRFRLELSRVGSTHSVEPIRVRFLGYLGDRLVAERQESFEPV